MILLSGCSGLEIFTEEDMLNISHSPKPFRCFMLQMPHCPELCVTYSRLGWAASPAHPGLPSLSPLASQACDSPHREEVNALPVFLVFPDPFLESVGSQPQPAQMSLPDQSSLGISPPLQGAETVLTCYCFKEQIH